MRTHFESTESEGFEATKDLLVRRCVAWADQWQLTVDPFVLGAALDFRHTGVDGRLTFWTAELARKFLLVWMPRAVSATVEEVSNAPESLRTLVHYLHHTELAEPTGDAPAAIETAITAAATEFPQAMSDNKNFGVAKFWTMAAIETGVDPTDHAAMNRFAEQAREGKVEHDSAALEHILTRHLTGDEVKPTRAPMMPPVSLPPEAELAAATENSLLVRQLRAFVAWLGRDGRSLTGTGQLKIADARELVALLNTGDTIDPVIGDRTYRTKSSAELTKLGLIITWAKKMRLVRVVKNRLVPIAKAKPVLSDATALWNRAFDALVELGDDILAPSSYGSRPFAVLYAETVPDLLRTMYGMPEAIPVVRLQETIWLACRASFHIEGLGESERQRLRQQVDSDVWLLLRALAHLPAVELTTGTADPIFLSDLDEQTSTDEDVDTLPADARENLRTALDPETGPIDLVRLTPPATARMHTWLVDEGRCAPVVGELIEAIPAQLLGTVAERHPPEAAKKEIDHWLSAHGPDGPDQLIEAVRQCPFRSRAAAMLGILSAIRTDGTALLRQLRSDDVLGPLAVQALMIDGVLEHDDLTEREQMLGMAEQLIHALELAGPEQVQEMLLADSSSNEAMNVIGAALASGHPADTGLEELRTLVAESLQEQSPNRLQRHPLAELACASGKQTTNTESTG